MAQFSIKPPPGLLRFRLGLIGFAGVLVLQAVWLLAVEAVRPAQHGIPTSAETAEAALVGRSAAIAAAWIGLVRGDLWADGALSYANLVWPRPGATRDPSGDHSRARTLANRALALSPHDARIWVLLAGLEARADPARVEPLLKMSYYVGASEIALTPFRMLVALRADAIADADLQQLLRGEMETILTRKPELRPAIGAAYQQASPAGRRFADAVLQDLDPSFLAALRAGTAGR